MKLFVQKEDCPDARAVKVRDDGDGIDIWVGDIIVACLKHDDDGIYMEMVDIDECDDALQQDPEHESYMLVHRP